MNCSLRQFTVQKIWNKGFVKRYKRLFDFHLSIYIVNKNTDCLFDLLLNSKCLCNDIPRSSVNKVISLCIKFT